MSQLGLFEPVIVTPAGATFHLLLTAQTPVSHHDAAVTDASNRQLFNRQSQVVIGDPASVGMPTSADLARLAEHHPAPPAVAAMLADLRGREVLAVVLLRLWLDIYNGADGSGLFEGVERYSRLEERLRQAAVSSTSLRGLWNRLADSLNVGIPAGRWDAPVMELLSLPGGMQQLVLETLRADYRATVQMARYWHTTAKEERRAAEETGVEPEWVAVIAPAEAAPGATTAQVIEVPAVSGNSLRHQVVREPGWWHLAGALGLRAASPGQGDVPPGVEALFYNGGNLLAGAKAPTNAFNTAWSIRARYPLLDLLGGNCNAFDLGSSRLRVAGWLICRENAQHVAGTPAADLPVAQVRAADLIDDVTQTRQAGRIGLGQMLRDFETLATGTQFIVKLHLDPTTPELTAGALVAAVETYRDDLPRIGGQSARGFGLVDVEWLGEFPEQYGHAREEYERYLETHRAVLRDGLTEGTLGEGQVILS